MDTVKQTKSAALYEYLLNYMRENHLKAGDKFFTEAELVKKFGVSRITVQSAFKQLQDGNYLHRKRGSGTYVTGKHNPMVSGDIKIVPLVIAYDSKITREFEIIKGVESFFHQHGIYLTLHPSKADFNYERAVVSELAERFDCMLILPSCSAYNKDLYSSLINRGKTLVFIDHFINGLSVNYVASDNIRGGYLATKHLCDLGHRRILLVSPGGFNAFSSFKSRYQGYKNALEELNIPLDPALVYEDNGEGESKVVEYIKSFPIETRPTGIFVLNDINAVKLLAALEEGGFSVPEDFDMVGFDNLDILLKQNEAVATVEQDFFRMGYLAAQTLYEKMSDTDDTVTVKKLPVKLVKRRTD
ncbi:MAG: GntR family transcriptional regulator [Clostridia bacterium]|nr:GntR family transcriptional regulator [Clostridia bacterium]